MRIVPNENMRRVVLYYIYAPLNLEKPLQSRSKETLTRCVVFKIILNKIAP